MYKFLISTIGSIAFINALTLKHMTKVDDGPPSGCSCLANGSENKAFCEGGSLNIESCLTFANNGKCDWGPKESSECMEEKNTYLQQYFKQMASDGA